MRALYSLGIFTYSLIIHIASIFNTKAKLWVNGRSNIIEKISKDVKTNNIVWIHAASVGEFEQAIPLIELIKQRQPKKTILVTFFSPSGYELRKNYKLADYVYYLPLDSQTNAKQFLDAIKPEIVFFVKYEFWFNYINEIKSRKIPLYLISGIFRENQYFFKWYGKWFKRHLQLFEHLFVQDKKSSDLLNSIQIKSNSIIGDTRFDRVNEVTKNPKEFDFIKEFVGDDKVLICGSTWAADESIILNYFEKHPKQIKLIIAPHEVDSDHIKNIEKDFQSYKPIKLSDLENKAKLDSNRVLIIDSIGKLLYLYQYADIAYIGGGFGVGIHNILEAACYGKPVFFGPNYSKFKEAHDMIRIGAAVSIKNKEEFENELSILLHDNKLLKTKSDICLQYVNENLGAANKIYDYCF